MRIRTGRVLVTTNVQASEVISNVWSDAAREASAQARKEGMKTPNPTPRGPGGLTDKENKMKAEGDAGRKNYQGLSGGEKAQFHKDWEAAHKASAHAKKNPSRDTHMQAAAAHAKAAKSAPTSARRSEHKQKQGFHVRQAAAHLSQMKNKTAGMQKQAQKKKAGNASVSKKLAKVQKSNATHQKKVQVLKDKISKTHAVRHKAEKDIRKNLGLSKGSKLRY